MSTTTPLRPWFAGYTPTPAEVERRRAAEDAFVQAILAVWRAKYGWGAP